MSEIVNKYINIVDPFISATYYRTLGINSVHVPIEVMLKFINADGNPFGGTVNMYWDGKKFQVYKWEDINLSKSNVKEPITFSAWLFGGGVNTVGVREHFYDLHLIRSAIEKQFGLKRGTLSVKR